MPGGKALKERSEISQLREELHKNLHKYPFLLRTTFEDMIVSNYCVSFKLITCS